MDSTTTSSTSSVLGPQSSVTPPHHSVNQILDFLESNDPDLMITAAQEIRLLTKTSHRCRRQLAPAIPRLVSMLRVDSPDSSESALLALLNLAVKDETNKMSIVAAGALNPIIRFLKAENTTLQENAIASLLTLSASYSNKPTIAASGAIPFLLEILNTGTQQAKVDAITALYNLSTHSNNIATILDSNPVPSIITLLKTSKKSSKTAEKCTGLLETLVRFEQARTKLVSQQGGVLAVVEVLERGSHQSREHAVGVLLTMCEADQSKYKDPILREGVIPGLLELTVKGSPKSQRSAQMLMRLLRDSPYPRPEVEPDTLENIVCNIISQMDGKEQSGKAKKMLAEMVQVSMEQSLRHLQKRALVCTPSDLRIASNTSKFSSAHDTKSQ